MRKGHSGQGEEHRQGHESGERARRISLVDKSAYVGRMRVLTMGLLTLITRPPQKLFPISAKRNLLWLIIR